MEEGGPSFGNNFSETCRHVISFFKVRKRAHWGHPSSPYHHGIEEEVQGRCGRRVEVGGGDFGGGESEERVGAICFYFPQPLAFFGFSPHNFLIRAKMHKSKKETKGRRHDPILTRVWPQGRGT